ncbi:H-2 class II histocompatibility antigen, E-S beta chain-like [Hemicordylus capensis]|uniref:H-2 class II histocompatibility antigen, E-S beta chain-like n=1 Tax=Hemicordylus capensis TaxID=884348 RepID=UPI002303E31C|nr:H-2 class II histocompatibility antigen, E-S beta chain-like [Hemicordylus capensis]
MSGSKEHFLYQTRSECHFTPNGTQQEVHYLDRYFWNRQEYVRFDSRVGEFQAITELGEPTARSWNNQKDFLEGKRHNVDRFCLYHFDIFEPFVSKRRDKISRILADLDGDSTINLISELEVSNNSSYAIRLDQFQFVTPEDVNKLFGSLYFPKLTNPDWKRGERGTLEELGAGGSESHWEVMVVVGTFFWVSQAEVGSFPLPYLKLCVSDPDPVSSPSPPVQPAVTITLTDYDRSSQNGMLVCNVDNFFPLEIEIKWLRNGKEEDPHKVVTTDVMENGDWSYQIHVMLETQLIRGDVFGCQVEHASFKGSVTVQWEPQTDSARSKKWTGVVGIVLGLVFLLPGLVLYLKNKKGRAIPQPGGLIS